MPTSATRPKLVITSKTEVLLIWLANLHLILQLLITVNFFFVSLI